VVVAVDRGWSAPGCTVPGYACDVHVNKWAGGGAPKREKMKPY
jgi:hypothetical protein